MKKSILGLFNRIKKDHEYPSILQPSNITSIWKKKLERSSLDNDRGIFNVVKLRSILDKMILDDVHDDIDQNMGPSNIGARKKRNIRDHLLVVNSVINDTLKNKDAEADINVYDVAKCFDKMSYKETGNDMFSMMTSL